MYNVECTVYNKRHHYDKKETIVIDKSLDFAILSIKLYKYLVNNKKETIISKQLLKSATSIGANIREANVSISKKEFISKLNISLKEAKETEYWLELLVKTNYIDNKKYDFLYSKCLELIKLLTSIIKTSVNNLNKN